MIYVVQVVQFGPEEKVAKEIDCGGSILKAGKVESGVDINLDHERYFTRIVEKQGDGFGQVVR